MRTLQSLPLNTGTDIRQVPCRCVGKYKRWNGEDTSPFDNFLSNGLKSSLTKHYELLGVDPRTLLGLQIHEVACNSFLFQGTADIPQSKPQTAYLFVTWQNGKWLRWWNQRGALCIDWGYKKPSRLLMLISIVLTHLSFVGGPHCRKGTPQKSPFFSMNTNNRTTVWALLSLLTNLM